jgi:intracellular septation protein
MKLFFDLLPVALFFAAYKQWDLYVATAVAMVAAGGLLLFVWLRHRRVEAMNVIVFAVIAVLGGATLLFHDERFIMWKPTLVNWLFALVFIGSHFIGDRPLIRRMMDSQMTLPDLVWKRLSWSWIAFFTVLGIANLYVAFYYAPDLTAGERRDIWVNFKLFGMMGLTFVFAIAQALYLARHVQTEEKTEE